MRAEDTEQSARQPNRLDPLSYQRHLRVPQVIAAVVANRQVVLVAATPFTQRLNVLQRGVLVCHVGTAHPARHGAVQLAGYRFVDFVAGVGGLAHAVGFYKSAANSMRLRPAPLAAYSAVSARW